MTLAESIDLAEQRADKLSSEANVLLLSGLLSNDDLRYTNSLQVDAANWLRFAELGKQLMKEFPQR